MRAFQLPAGRISSLSTLMDQTNNPGSTKARKSGGAARHCALPKLLVLHVDDDPNDTALLQAAISRAGVHFQLHNIHDAEQTICYLAGQGVYADRARYPFPSLILLDLKMPRQTGFEILRWIRSRPELSDLPVVILSGSEL